MPRKSDRHNSPSVAKRDQRKHGRSSEHTQHITFDAKAVIKASDDLHNRLIFEASKRILKQIKQQQSWG